MTHTSHDALQWALSNTLLDPKHAAITPLSGGLVNRVWRAYDRSSSILLKHTTDHLSSNPSIPIDPARGNIETEALRWAPQFASHNVQTPTLLAHDPQRRIFATTFVDNARDLNSWLDAPTTTDARAGALGTRLGSYLNTLHTSSAQHPQRAQRLRNDSIQTTRAHIQYNAVRSWFQDTPFPIPSHAALHNAQSFGETCTLPGQCLIHGDLWTRSILLQPSTTPNLTPPVQTFLIDWEFAHWGRPAQDLGHIAAHLILHEAHTHNPTPTYTLRRNLFDAYTPLPTKTATETLIHTACEILIRTLGPFSTEPHAAHTDLIQNASRWLEDPATYTQDLLKPHTAHTQTKRRA